MTGRGAGYCAGYGVPGYANPVPGRGFWGGRGGGRGWRNRVYATGLPGWARAGYAPAWGAGYAPAWGAGPYPAQPTPAQEASVLKAQAENLRAALEGIEKRLQALEDDAQ